MTEEQPKELKKTITALSELQTTSALQTTAETVLSKKTKKGCTF